MKAKMSPQIRKMLGEVVKQHLMTGGSMKNFIAELPRIVKTLSGGIVIGGSAIEGMLRGGSAIDSMLYGGSLESDLMDLAQSKPAKKLIKKGKKYLGLGVLEDIEHFAESQGVPKSVIKKIHDSGLPGVAERSVRDTARGLVKLAGGKAKRKGGLMIGGKGKRKLTPYNKFVRDMRLQGYSMREIGPMWQAEKRR